MPEIVAHYRLMPTALQTEEKRIRTPQVSTLVLVVTAASVLFVALGLSKGATPTSMITYSVIMAAYIAYLVVWYPRRIRRRLIRCWETFELEIGHDYLSRRQADIPELRLRFDEVQAVEHVQGRYLRVIGKSKGRVLAIPEGIEQFGEVLNTISSICPVRVRRIEQWQKYRGFMSAGLLVLVMMIWATSPVVVIPLSLAMSSLIVWIFVWIRRNPNIPEGTKRIAWFYWLLFAMCLLKLFVALGGVDQGSAALGKIVANILVFSPCALLVFGWVQWGRARTLRWLNDAIAWGLAAASISALCLYGVISYIQLAHISHSNEHRLAIAGVYAGCPLAVFSLIAGGVGEGRSRVIVLLAGALLVLVWSVAFFYA